MDLPLQYADEEDIEEQLIHLAKIRLVDPEMAQSKHMQKDKERKIETKQLDQQAELTGCESSKSNLNQTPLGNVKFKLCIP